MVIIAIGESTNGEKLNIKHNLEIFKKVIPAIAKFACRSVLLVITRPTEIMSYVTWKLSKFPSNRVLGIGTLIDTMRFQCCIGDKLDIANSSIGCMRIGAQGYSSGL